MRKDYHGTILRCLSANYILWISRFLPFSCEFMMFFVVINNWDLLFTKSNCFFFFCYEVGCVSPYYLQQVGLNHQHGSVYTNDLLHGNNVMIPSGGYEKRTTTEHKKQLSDTTTTRMPMSSSSLRYDRFALRDHCYYGEGINGNSSGRKTLALFPLQPLDATNDDGVGNSSFALGSDSPGVCSGDGGGREQPFIDFFSGGTSRRFDSSGNAL